MIPIRNIYYMLSYAFQTLNENAYKKITTEQFHNTAELCSAILCYGIKKQIKRGFYKEYIEHKESISMLKGKLELNDSIKNQEYFRNKMICSFEEFSTNIYINQIIKSTMLLLLCSNVGKERKRELKKLLIYFSNIDQLDIHRINWNVHYNKNNKTYQLLISVCYLVIKGLLQTQIDGSEKLMEFFDEQHMSRLYEKFILEYYRKEFPQLNASPSFIKWQLDDDTFSLLPIMKSDVTLRMGNRILIIDTKYYEHIFQNYFDTNKIRSGHIYQIFTYVKNKTIEMEKETGIVSGLILYAGNSEKLQPDVEYQMSGNTIMVKTLNLDVDFTQITRQLNNIVENYFML